MNKTDEEIQQALADLPNQLKKIGDLLGHDSSKGNPSLLSLVQILAEKYNELDRRIKQFERPVVRGLQERMDGEKPDGTTQKKTRQQRTVKKGKKNP